MTRLQRLPSTRLPSAAAAVSFALLLSTAAPAGAAAQELITDRPDFTESARSVVRGRAQLEAGYTFASAGSSRSHALGEVLVRVGVGRGMELRLAAGSWEWSEGEAGAAGAALGGKAELWQTDAAAGALLAAVLLPDGAGGEGGAEVKLAAAWDLPLGLGLGLNGNAAWLRDDGGYWEPSASASLGVPLRGPLAAFVEVYGFAPAGRENAAFANAGLTWALRPHLQLDVRVGSRLFGGERSLGIGLARRW